MKKRHSAATDDTVFEISDDNQGVFTPRANSKNEKPARSKEKKKRNIGSEPGAKDPVGLRIIGGKFRGSKLQYVGDNRVRPMKDRVREAVFNLIGPAIRNMHVVDLFGGTGAMTIEAISRGAASATVVEIHLPTAALLRQNLESLNLLGVCELRKTDAFFWAKNREEHPTGTTPWLVFCCPPYGFYVDRQEEMLEMIRTLHDASPDGSMLLVESDDRFDFNLLPVKPHPNKVRSYPPAEVAIIVKESN